GGSEDGRALGGLVLGKGSGDGAREGVSPSTTGPEPGAPGRGSGAHPDHAGAGAGPAWAQTIRDVPTDHWAYAAVQRLINKGYLTLEDNQMFYGDRPVDRYTFAVAVARVLDQVEHTGGTLPRETQELLTRLATEFQEELVAWHAAREELERRTAALSADVQALTAAGGALDSILARVRELEEATAQRGQDVAALARELEQLREDLGLQTGTLDQRLAEFQNQ